MRLSRWLDHLPPWLAWGAVAASRIYEPVELAGMALPLVAAAGVEALRRDLSPLRRWLEAGALVFFLGDLLRGAGIFATAIHTLFLLVGLRLALPRERPQQRQLLLMGFLLFLTSALGPSDPDFLAWALAWMTAAAAALLQQSWEDASTLRRGPAQPAPLRRTPVWALGAAAFGALFFVVLPRASLGLRPPAFLGVAALGSRAGLSDRLDLAGEGPVAPNPDVVLRIIPGDGADPARDPGWADSLQLLKGVVLETARASRWEVAADTPPREIEQDPLLMLRPGRFGHAEFYLSPTPHGILPLPYGLLGLGDPPAPIRGALGGSLRWRYPIPRALPLQVAWSRGGGGPRELRLRPLRWAVLTYVPPEQEAARRWSLQLAPEILPAEALARKLVTALRSWRYTLENPSGRAANPLEDFLDRTHAGHCEYYASALALMLRARGVPARVVNGYRLGPWIAEGGYFRISQDQAHSWVEYWDAGTWRIADPTPAAPAASADGGAALGRLARWADALRYRWDRYVVRFSDQDQQEGLGWLRTAAAGWTWPGKRTLRTALALLVALAGAWALARRLRRRPVPDLPGRIPALRPLLGRLRRKCPPAAGETARAWLLRLAALRPERRDALLRLADAVDREAYGADPSGRAAALARAEAAAWRGWKPTS